MKKTEEINEDEILVIISKEDAEEFKSLATGKRFCKKGERITDICKEEFARKEYQNLGLISRIFHRKRFKSNKNELLLECRLTSNIRRVAVYLLSKEENALINELELEKQTKDFIMNKVEKFFKDKK